MNHIYHVQHEVMAYYKHIPKVPKTLAVEKKLLYDLEEDQFLENLHCFIDIMKRMYLDIEARPEEYGMLLIDIHEVNENKEEGNLAKASWRSVKRLGNVIAAIGRDGEIEGDTLKISIDAFKIAVKKIDKLSLLLGKMVEFGFSFTNYNGKSFDKGAEFFFVEYKEMPYLLRVLKAYSVAEPYHSDDPHEFYYFDYKRVARRDMLPVHCVAEDLAALIDEDKGKLLVELNRHFVEEMGLIPQYKDDSIEYYLKSKRVARYMIDFHDLSVHLILKLKDMDRYIDHIKELPTELRSRFEDNSCRYCGFQNSTAEFCKFRISWTLNDRKIDACNFASFYFYDPKSEYVESYVTLMKAEYKVPKGKK